ncbi:hypothetical protein L7F22_065780 [Adiantum nelumboides]|nr:hypothetical protein [Adiantum nelumboides]
MTEETMQQLGLELTGKSMFSVKMANSSRVKCLGVIHDLEINVLGQWAVMDIHIMPAKLGAYPVILGRPWLIAMRSRQDWYRGCIDLFVDRPKDKRIRYDMKTCKVLEIDDEPAMHQDLSSTHDMYDSYSSASSTCTDDEVYDQSLLDLDVDLCGIHVSTKSGEKEGAENSEIHHEADHEPNYPSDNAKLQKWLLNLQQFDMNIIKEDSVRANMADMLTFKEINVKNDMKKDLERKIVPSPTMHEELQDVEGTLYFDGAFKRSINKGAAGYVFFDKNGVEGWFGSQEVDVKSNNEAEYASLCVGLNECIKRHVKRILIKGDSMLVIKQIQGTWKVNKEGMKDWFFKVRRLLKFFHVYQIWYVPRNMNMRAHELAEQVFVKDVHVVAIIEPRYFGRESLYEEEHVLQTGFARKGLSSQQRHEITRRAMKYAIIGEHLYHKGVDGVMRRVLYQDEVFDWLKACHKEGCGGHFRVEIKRRKVLDAQLMWPSMNRDVVHWCKSCHEYQVYQKRKLLFEPLKGIVSYGPFEKWGIDVIGPLPGTRNGKHYILSAMDYMTKWPEAKASRGATSKDVCNFIFDCICCRFGVPLELVSDQGKEFRNDLIEDLVKKLEIKHRYSTPYHPQCNGLVEAFNGVLQKKILFKLVEEHPKDWDMCLERAL